MTNFLKEDLEIARSKLLELYGIGPEIADTLLLYAADKPTFIIDEYAKRFFSNHLSLTGKLDFYHLKSLFENNLPKDVKVYQNYHALIIVEQKGKENSLMETL